MKSFPKKYKPKDLRNRSNLYRKEWKNNEISNIFFSPNTLSCSKKIWYFDFFQIYLKDFFNYKSTIENIQNKENENISQEQLFIIYWNQIQNIQSNFEFFNKKNQWLLQIWVNKLERHIISSNKKYTNINNKILDSYASSNHKFYIPDSDLYIYILEQFHKLWDNWKIREETKIWYRSFNLQTSIPTENITRKEEKTPYYILKYFVWAKCEALPIYVEDIDSCCGDVALLVHPKDKRYNKYIWKNAIIPLCNRQIPIIWDENVNIAINNWIKRICPCSDEESITLAKKFWLPTDIYVFDKEWLYTWYIHESAFIWKNREKYYNNIVGFIEDIWNLSNKWEKTIRIPYLTGTNERLVPYKMNQILIDTKEEKEKIIEKIINKDLNFSFLNIDNFEFPIESNDYPIENEEDIKSWTDNTDEKNQRIKQEITKEIDKYLPEYIICNSQIPYLRKIPLIKSSDWNLEFFDIEKDFSTRKDNTIQKCFNFVVLSLIRSWAIWQKYFWDKENAWKLCEYDKFPLIIFQNEKKIAYLIEYLSKITWEKSEYNEFLKIIENILDENNSTKKDFLNLTKNSKFLKHEWNRLSINIDWIINDTFDGDFIQSCILCYLHHKNININNQVIINKDERKKIFKELVTQELLLWNTISTKFLEYSYDDTKDFSWDKQLTKLQLEQFQRNLFSIYWENPIRLCFLINKSFDEKKIVINNIFLKQIRNATRLCIQKGFLPKNIKEVLENQPEDFDDFDISVLEKLNDLYYDRKDTQTYEDFTKFFESFKDSSQNVFFSRYLEIQKINPTKSVQFVCSYFFNFLFTIFYPLVPEFIDALQYVSERNFLIPVESIKLNRTMDYNMNILYNTFIQIKEMKIEYNIKQHEYCNIFIKSNPTICELFSQYEQIFINYFHISDIIYLRLHEQTPLWYEIFSNDTLTIWIQPWNTINSKEKDSLENIEKNIKNLDDKLNLLRQRLQILWEWEERKKAEEEYAKTKEEIENLTIKYSLLNGK